MKMPWLIETPKVVDIIYQGLLKVVSGVVEKYEVIGMYHP